MARQITFSCNLWYRTQIKAIVFERIDMKKPIILGCAITLLSSCGLLSFAPSVDAKVTTNLQSATASMSHIAACIELGSCAGKNQISQVEDRYVDAFSNANLALSIAEKTETSGDRAAQAKELFVEEIIACRDAIKRQFEAHKQFASLQNAGLAAPNVVICELATDASRALSRL